MLPLIPLAISLVPELIRLIAGDKAGTVATTVANVVSEVTGTADPAEAQAKLAQDPAIIANLRIRLAEIALEAQKVQNAEADQQRQAELATMQAAIQDTTDARARMVDLVKAGSPISYAPAIVSVVVTAGFFLFLIIMLVINKQLDNVTAQIINIAVGALTAGFATVINFWLGSSKGSRDKDEAAIRIQASKDVSAAQLQSSQANQTLHVIESLKSIATTAVSQAPTAPPPPVVVPVPAPVATVTAPLTVVSAPVPAEPQEPAKPAAPSCWLRSCPA